MTHAPHHVTPNSPMHVRAVPQSAPMTGLEQAGRSRLGQTLRAHNAERRAQSQASLGVFPCGVAPEDPADIPPGFRNPLAPFAPAPVQRVLVPVIGINDELTPAFERSLLPIAVRAVSGDRIARDALYAAFELKLRRVSWRIRVPWVPSGTLAIWDRDDVAQEVYLTFLDVLATWDEAIPFGRYVLAQFPWRLRDRVYRGIARSGVPPRVTAVTIDGRDVVDTETTDGLETRMVLDALATAFGAPYDEIIRLHIGEGIPLMAVAARLRMPRRTLTRRWREVRDRLRADLLQMRDAS